MTTFVCKYPGCGKEFISSSNYAKWCPDCKPLVKKAQSDKYYHSHKDDPTFKAKRNKSNKQWRLNNPEKSKKAEKEYRDRNKEKRNKYNKEYKALNRDKIREYNRRYNEKNREAKREYNRRARLLQTARRNPGNPELGMLLLEPELITCPRAHSRHRKSLCGTFGHCEGGTCPHRPEQQKKRSKCL